MARSRIFTAWQANQIVRRLSAPNMNKTVDWMFFNQVYDALAEAVEVERERDELRARVAGLEKRLRLIERTDWIARLLKKGV